MEEKVSHKVEWKRREFQKTCSHVWCGKNAN